MSSSVRRPQWINCKMLTFSKDAQDALNRVDVDHLATSIDDEVERLGLEHIDILKLSISSMDILRPQDCFAAVAHMFEF